MAFLYNENILFAHYEVIVFSIWSHFAILLQDV